MSEFTPISISAQERLLTIGVLAKRVGIAVSAIRYYEEVGLIPPAKRRESGHRVYPESIEDALVLIRHCRDLGFSIGATRELVELSSSAGTDCVEALTIAQKHLTVMRAKMAELRLLEQNLARYVQTCKEGCVGGSAPDCAIFVDLRQGIHMPPRPTGCCS